MQKIAGCALIALMVLTAAAFAQSGDIDTAALAEDCAGCHGDGGASEVPDFPIIGGQIQDYLWQSLRNYKDSVRTDDMMQSFAEMLSYDELRALSGYYAGKEWANTTAGFDEDLAKKGSKLIGDCSRCHKKDGMGLGTVPRLAGQHVSYLETALTRYKNDERGLNVMTQFSKNYDEADFPAMANYYAGLPELKK